MPPHSKHNAVVAQLSLHRLSRRLAPVVHLSLRPILGRVTRSTAPRWVRGRSRRQKCVKEGSHG